MSEDFALCEVKVSGFCCCLCCVCVLSVSSLSLFFFFSFSRFVALGMDRSKQEANTMEMDTEKALKSSFVAAANHLSHLYTTSLSHHRQAYLQGYQKATRETLEFVLKRLQDGASQESVEPLLQFLKAKMESNPIEVTQKPRPQQIIREPEMISSTAPSLPPHSSSSLSFPEHRMGPTDQQFPSQAINSFPISSFSADEQQSSMQREDIFLSAPTHQPSSQPPSSMTMEPLGSDRPFQFILPPQQQQTFPLSFHPPQPPSLDPTFSPMLSTPTGEPLNNDAAKKRRQLDFSPATSMEVTYTDLKRSKVSNIET
jgi:hypothetical protein